MEGLREQLKKTILSDIDMSVAMDDEAIGRIIDRRILEESKGSYIPVKEKVSLRMELFNSLRRLDVLTEYLEDEEISEIMVNGYNSIFIEKHGRIIKTNKSFDSEEKLKAVIQQIVADCNRRINEANPIVDARLSDGSRVNIVMSPVALGGPVVTVRRFPQNVIDMERLVELGSVDAELVPILKMFVTAGYNIFISGGTGSGKTTFLNALADFIPKDERIITIEDSAELQIRGIDNLVRLEARSANTEGENCIGIRDLIKASLRMRPSRIIVGEVRDEAAIDMLQAMNTGHDGSISTGHANSCQDMLSRLETMFLMGIDIPLTAVKKQIASAVDIIIHLGRLRDKSRRLMKICEVKGMENNEIILSTLFEFVELSQKNGRIKGKMSKVNDLFNVQKLEQAGLFQCYREVEGGLQSV